MSLRFQFSIVAVLWIAFGSSFGNAETSERPVTDQWAGKPVAGSAHVHDMIKSRLFNAPVVAEKAPETVVVDAKGGKEVRLSDLHREKPVVLFFASNSCTCSQEAAPEMSKLAKTFSDRFQFVLIYIREAHPPESVADGAPGKQFSIDDPNTLKGRAHLALEFAKQHSLEFPVLTDTINDRQAVQWAAWPSRLFVVDQKGTVVYAGQQGPWFVKPTPGFDLGLGGVPESIRDLEGYSRESLETFLTNYR
ncbi:deiodinase-like protein [Verrucomicrobiales bacterium BCK34]|nr:deiodinase-like protein [Verrucomicrobiales bacterium BCK34]